MIIDLQRRIHECGRIRIGQQVPTGNSGKTRPAKLATFRLTSPDRTRLDAAAQLWGGTVTPWQAPSGSQWEVVTDSDVLSVVVPPSEMAFSQHMELWSAGGCRRRCDGRAEQISQGPCLCDPENRECQVHTRLSVMLADLSGLGVWRLDTQGWNAAVELSGAVEVMQVAAGRGVLLPAQLRLEQRQVKRFDDQGRPQTRNFAVPVLDVQISPAQLLGDRWVGRLPAPALAIGSAPDNPRLTPVPAGLEPGPSIAEQAAPPPPRPKRANSAQEIPPSGRDRRTTPNGGTTKPAADAPPAPVADTSEPVAGDRMTQPQQRKLFALIREHDIVDRNDWASGLLGREVTSFGQLTGADASTLIDSLGADETPPADDTTGTG